MTPKQKADKLIQKYRSVNVLTGENSKMIMSYEDCRTCALIAVDEIMTNGLLENQPKFNKMRGDATTPAQTDYWSDVKNEIKKT